MSGPTPTLSRLFFVLEVLYNTTTREVVVVVERNDHTTAQTFLWQLTRLHNGIGCVNLRAKIGDLRFDQSGITRTTTTYYRKTVLSLTTTGTGTVVE